MLAKRAMSSISTQLLKVDPNAVFFDAKGSLHVSDELTRTHLERAAHLLSACNEVVAFPTETVYGLGGNAFSDDAIRGIYAAKNRPADNPLIVHLASLEQVSSILGISLPKIYQPLLSALWPGPLTVLLPVPANSRLSPLTTAGQPTVAVRVPSNPVARALILLAGVPLAAPSANTSTRPSPTRAGHVLHDLSGIIPLIVDGGSCPVGVESTVVDGLSSPPRLLRPGGISQEQLQKFPGWEHVQVYTMKDQNEPVKTPGMKYKHYSPTAKVILVRDEESLYKFLKDEKFEDSTKLALLTGLKFKGDNFKGTVRSLGANKAEIASNLFNDMRLLDEKNVDIIFIEVVDKTDEGLAIMNRLEKAATQTI